MVKKGYTGWRAFDGKGNSIQFESGYTAPAPEGEEPDMHQGGDFLKVSENGTVTRLAAAGNTTLDDPSATTITIKYPDGTKVKLQEHVPTDDPGDGDEGDEGDLGDAGDAGAGAAAGE